jgi:hypothetical protein
MSVSNTFIAGTDAKAAELNTNFAEVVAELNAFPTSGYLKNGAVTFGSLNDTAVETSTEGITSTDVAIPTSKAVVNYVADNTYQRLVSSGIINGIRNWTSGVSRTLITGLTKNKRNRIIIQGHTNNAVNGVKGVLVACPNDDQTKYCSWEALLTAQTGAQRNNNTNLWIPLSTQYSSTQIHLEGSFTTIFDIWQPELANNNTDHCVFQVNTHWNLDNKSTQAYWGLKWRCEGGSYNTISDLSSVGLYFIDQITEDKDFTGSSFTVSGTYKHYTLEY